MPRLLQVGTTHVFSSGYTNQLSTARQTPIFALDLQSGPFSCSTSPTQIQPKPVNPPKRWSHIKQNECYWGGAPPWEQHFPCQAATRSSRTKPAGGSSSYEEHPNAIRSLSPVKISCKASTARTQASAGCEAFCVCECRDDLVPRYNKIL